MAPTQSSLKPLAKTVETRGDIYQDVEFWAGHELYEPGQNTHGHHMMDALIVALCEVGQGPAGV